MPNITEMLGKASNKKDDSKKNRKKKDERKKKSSPFQETDDAKNAPKIDAETLEEGLEQEDDELDAASPALDGAAEQAENDNSSKDAFADMLGGGQKPPKETEPIGLEAIQEAGANFKEPQQNKSKLNSDTIKEMMMTGDNSDGIFTPNIEEVTDKDEVVHENVDDEAKVETSGEVTSKGDKYIKLLQSEMKNNPNDFIIRTPKGNMKLSEALAKGYDPITREFNGPKLEDELNGMMAGLSDADKQSIANLTNPMNARIPQAEAGKYGLDANNPMLQQAPPQSAPMPQGMPQSAPMPQAPMPQQAPAPAQQNGADIMSLLGGAGGMM